MQVNVEQIDPCKVQMTIEVDPETVIKTVDEVYREYAKYRTIPGFRKGKAPRAIIERYVTPDEVKERAVEKMVAPVYIDAIKEHDIHPYADPDLEIVQYEVGQPFIFKAEIPLPPKVELGEYKGIEAERKQVEITDEDVEETLKNLQDRHSTAEKVEDRGVQETDIVIAQIASQVEGEESMGEQRHSLIRLGDNIPGFDENIIGLKPGERKTFELEYPADFGDEALAGKKAQFDVTVDSIRERKVPALDDVFAKTVGNFESIDALREDAKKQLVESAEESADREVEQKIVDEIVSRSNVCIPDVMLNHEVYHEVQELQENMSRRGITVEQYLEQTGKTKDELLNEIREAVDARIKTGLVLGEISDVEDIDVTDEDVEAEIGRIAESSNAERDAVEAFIETKGGRTSLRNSMLNRKILDYLKSVSTIK